MQTVNAAETSVRTSGSVLARVTAGAPGTLVPNLGGAGGDIDVVDYGFKGGMGGQTSSASVAGAKGILTCPPTFPCPWSDVKFNNAPGSFEGLLPVIATGAEGVCSSSSFAGLTGGAGLLILTM
jgi:hypothetical protein